MTAASEVTPTREDCITYLEALDLGRYGGPVWIEYRDAILQHIRSHRPEGRERVGEERLAMIIEWSKREAVRTLGDEVLPWLSGRHTEIAELLTELQHLRSAPAVQGLTLEAEGHE
jgi:hypothetical protein